MFGNFLYNVEKFNVYSKFEEIKTKVYTIIFVTVGFNKYSFRVKTFGYLTSRSLVPLYNVVSRS